MSSCTVFVFLRLIEYAFGNVMMGDISEVERKDKASHLRSIILTANHVPYVTTKYATTNQIGGIDEGNHLVPQQQQQQQQQQVSEAAHPLIHTYTYSVFLAIHTVRYIYPEIKAAELAIGNDFNCKKITSGAFISGYVPTIM